VRKIADNLEGFMDVVRSFNASLTIDDISIEPTDSGNWSVYNRFSRKRYGTVRGNLIDSEVAEDAGIEVIRTPSSGDFDPPDPAFASIKREFSSLGSSRRPLKSSMSFNDPVISEAAYAFTHEAITPGVVAAIIHLRDGVGGESHMPIDLFNQEVKRYSGISIPDGTVSTIDEVSTARQFVHEVLSSPRGWEGVSDEALSNPAAKGWRNSSRSVNSGYFGSIPDEWGEEDIIFAARTGRIDVLDAKIRLVDHFGYSQEEANLAVEGVSGQGVDILHGKVASEREDVSPGGVVSNEDEKKFFTSLSEMLSAGTITSDQATMLIEKYKEGGNSEGVLDGVSSSRKVRCGVEGLNFREIVSSAELFKLKLNDAGSFQIDMGHIKNDHEVYSSLKGVCDVGQLIAIGKKAGFTYSEITSGVDFTGSGVLPELKKFLTASAQLREVKDPVIKRSVASWAISGKELEGELTKWGLKNPGGVFSRVDVLGVDLDGTSKFKAPVKSDLDSLALESDAGRAVDEGKSLDEWLLHASELGYNPVSAKREYFRIKESGRLRGPSGPRAYYGSSVGERLGFKKPVASGINPVHKKVYDDYISEYESGSGDRDYGAWFMQHQQSISQDIKQACGDYVSPEDACQEIIEYYNRY
jgi:hypothetical protein